MAADSQPWTTSRCNRLLRPISSRLATLRKELDKQKRVASDARRATATSSKLACARRTNASQPARTRKPRDFDTDWAPTAKPAGTRKKTYGGHAKRKPNVAQRLIEDAGTSARPGQIASTPLITRISSTRLYESPQLHSSPLKGKKQGPIVANFPQIKNLQAQMPEVAKVVHGLLDAYAKMLQATHAGEPRSRKGARSLMSTCLHKMPAYIELEEHFAELDREEAEGDDYRDIPEEIYIHLEETFTFAPGAGWQNFKKMVRAHATALMCDAFADGVFEIDALSAVMDVCRQASAWQEAEKFLWTFLPNLKPIPLPLSVHHNLFESSTSVYMVLTFDFVKHTGRNGFLFDLLEHMVSQELLPLEWFATLPMRFIRRMLRDSISQENHPTFGHAVRFLQTMIYAGVGLPDDSVFQDGDVDVVLKQIKPSVRRELRESLDATFNIILCQLASTALICGYQAECLDEKTVHRVTWVLDCIAIGLLRRNDIRSDLELLDTTTENMQTFAERALGAIAASCAVHIDGCSLPTDMVSLQPADLIKSFSWVSHQYSCADIDVASALATLPKLFMVMARDAGDPTAEAGFPQLQGIVEGLLSLDSIQLPHKLWSLKRLALETSVTFAAETNRREHYAYARKIEDSMSLKGRVVLMNTPRKDGDPSAPRGIRLEEGIGEWVACTPFTAHVAEKTQSMTIDQLSPGWKELTATSTPFMDVDEAYVSEVTKEDIWAVADIDEEELWGETPIKKGPRHPISSLGKRTRAPSPMVVIPIERIRLTPPPIFFDLSLDDSGISFAPDISTAPRRSRRPNKGNAAVKKGRRTSRRNIAPKNYVERIEVDEQETADDEEEEDEDPQSTEADSNSDDELGKTPAGMKMKAVQQRSRFAVEVRIPSAKIPSVKIPTVPSRIHRRSSLRITKRAQTQTLGRVLHVRDSEDKGTEDELSFGF